MTVRELVRAPSGLRTCRGSKSGEPGGPTAAAVGQGHRRGGGREKRRGGRRSRGKDESRSGEEPQDLSRCCRPLGGREEGCDQGERVGLCQGPSGGGYLYPGQEGQRARSGGCGARGAGGGQEAREAATAQSGPEGPAARADLAPTCPGVTVGASGPWKRSARVDSYETLTA